MAAKKAEEEKKAGGNESVSVNPVLRSINRNEQAAAPEKRGEEEMLPEKMTERREEREEPAEDPAEEEV